MKNNSNFERTVLFRVKAKAALTKRFKLKCLLYIP